MKFVIRDDDLNYFSKPADIERWYARVFAQDVPVGFSTIPFVRGSSDVYTNSKEDGEFPVSENSELIEYVKANSFIEVLQHGCTHETVNEVYEYAQSRDLTVDTVRGKEELEKAFNQEIKVFVPPHDWISASGVRAIEQANMDIIRGRGAGIRNLIFRKEYLKNFLKLVTFRFPNFTAIPPVYPFVIDFGKHKEMCSYRLEDEDIFDGLEAAHAVGGNFVAVTHLHTYTDEKVVRLEKLINRASELGADFVKPNNIFNT